MKVLSWNVNGLRSVSRKGLREFLEREDPDILCLQEIKIQEKQLTDDVAKFEGYFSYYSFAKKPGYSGVAIFSKEKPREITYSLGLERFETEGRILELHYPQFTLLNLYMPHGGRRKENLAYKLDCYQHLLNRLKTLKENVILSGDFNIAHKEIDLARPKQNKNNIMFTPEEREQLDTLSKLGFIDAFREFNKEEGNYSWWPYYRKARIRNIGWRIDYCFISKSLNPNLQKAFILPRTPGSDHCPIGIDLK